MNTFLVTRNLSREMDQLFEDFWLTPSTTTASQWNPACDIEENEDHYLMALEMPGVPKDQIKIEYVDNRLTVSGERRRYGKFSRSFSLPAGVNAEKVEANYEDGVLRLYIPKAEIAKPRQIKIGSSGNGFFGKLLGKPEEKKTDHVA